MPSDVLPTLSWKKKLVAGAIILTSFLLGLFSMRGDTAIVDEIAHIPAGYTYVIDGDYRLNPEHPPLMKVLAGMPLAFLHLTFPYDLPDWRDLPNGQWESGWKFLYERGNDPAQILFYARMPILLSFVVLLFFVFDWARRLWGDKTAFVALGLAAFCPNLLAHARYVTTDLGVAATFLIVLYAYWRFLKAPSWKLLLWAMLAFAAAQLAKFSNVLLFPYLGLLTAVLWLMWRGPVTFPRFPFTDRFKRPWVQRGWVLFGSLAIVFLGGMLLTWIAYAPFIWNMPTTVADRLIDASLPAVEFNGVRTFLHGLAQNNFTKPVGHYLLGVLMVFTRVKGGNTTYFLGEVTNQSFWWFYPISFLMKTPIPLLVGSVLTLVLMFRGFRQRVIPQAHLRKGGTRQLFVAWRTSLVSASHVYLAEGMMLGAILLFFVIGIAGNLNIGLRHILPLYPFLSLLVAKYVVEFVRGARLRRKIAVGLFGVWYVVGTVLAYPHFLSYFNEVIPLDQAYRHTTDSNLDWGQDLGRLAAYVEEKKIDRIQVDYFGGGLPAHELGDRYVEWHASNGPTTGWIAVSATFFQNSRWYAQCCGEQDYRWLEAYKPEVVIGGSILVFHVPE